MDSSELVVFDLDGTLLKGDATASWLSMALKRSTARLLVALVVLAPSLMLVRYPPLRRYGASALMWIATVGLNDEQLRRVFASFAADFHARKLPIRWYADAIDTLDRHLRAGDRVVVVTATPQWLAEELLQPWRSSVAVIGSSLTRKAGGWVLQRHCRGSEKCRMLTEQGFGQSWTKAYSDSDDDAPMLKAARQAFMINSRQRTIARARAAGLDQMTLLRWR